MQYFNQLGERMLSNKLKARELLSRSFLVTNVSFLPGQLTKQLVAKYRFANMLTNLNYIFIKKPKYEPLRG